MDRQPAIKEWINNLKNSPGGKSTENNQKSPDLPINEEKYHRNDHNKCYLINLQPHSFATVTNLIYAELNVD